jgi:hypothetical protein
MNVSAGFSSAYAKLETLRDDEITVNKHAQLDQTGYLLLIEPGIVNMSVSELIT